jgi:hypothetical protein
MMPMQLPVLNAPPESSSSAKRTIAPRRITRQIRLGKVLIGGGAPITVQSMTKTETADVEATLWQIRDMIMAGCEIVRVTANTIEAADVFDRLVAGCSVPIIADVHFDHRCAIRVMERGVTGLRLNPGNIGARWKVEEVTRMAADKGIPIRIGVNAGSLEKDLLKKYGEPTPEAMVESAFRHIEILESLGFFEGLSQGVERADDGRGVPALLETERLSAAPGRDGGRLAVHGDRQVVPGIRDFAGRGDRRHHPGLARRGPGRRGSRRPGNPEGPSPEG